MNTFEIGKTYIARSFCNHDCVWECTVISRTAKSVKLQEKNGKTYRRMITTDIHGERVALASYSMAPILCACDVAA